eukprot:2457514-Amphidinium_carterae.1
MEASSSDVLCQRGGKPEGQEASLSSDVLCLREGAPMPTDEIPTDMLGPEGDSDIELSPTEELRVMEDEEELQFWRQIWSLREEPMEFNLETGRPGDEFFDRKNKALRALKKGKYRLFDAYVLPCYPLNVEHRRVRNGLCYNPQAILNSSSLVGKLTLCPKREVAWLTTRTKILNTLEPRKMAEWERREHLEHEGIAGKLSDFGLQTSGQLRDWRGYDVPGGRAP